MVDSYVWAIQLPALAYILFFADGLHSNVMGMSEYNGVLCYLFSLSCGITNPRPGSTQKPAIQVKIIPSLLQIGLMHIQYHPAQYDNG